MKRGDLGVLVKFAIDPQSLMSDDAITRLEDLLERWQFFGILVNFDDVDDALDAARSTVNQNVIDAWDKIVTANESTMACPSERYRTGHPDDFLDAELWDVLSKQPDAQSIAHQLAARRGGHDLELAVLEGAAAIEAVAYLADATKLANASPNSIKDLIKKEFGGVEPTGLAKEIRVQEATRFLDAKDLSVAKIFKDMNHARLWKSRFQRLAAYSGKIVIVDQWALSDGNIKGFVKMLRYIDQFATNNCPTLTLYSRPQYKRGGITVDFNKEIPRLRELLAGAVTRLRVRVRLLEPQLDFHDRYIRFDHNVFTTSKGLADAFKVGNSVQEESIDCTLKDALLSLTEMKEEENRLDDLRDYYDKKVKWTAEDTFIAIN